LNCLLEFYKGKVNSSILYYTAMANRRLTDSEFERINHEYRMVHGRRVDQIRIDNQEAN